MINSLEGLHLVQPINSATVICPQQIPLLFFIRLILEASKVWQSHIVECLRHVPYYVVLGLFNVYDQFLCLIFDFYFFPFLTLNLGWLLIICYRCIKNFICSLIFSVNSPLLRFCVWFWPHFIHSLPFLDVFFCRLLIILNSLIVNLASPKFWFTFLIWQNSLSDLQLCTIRMAVFKHITLFV